MYKYLTTYINASKQGLGVVLMQDKGVIAYTLKKLKTHEELYSTRDLKLAIVVLVLNFRAIALQGEALCSKVITKY